MSSFRSQETKPGPPLRAAISVRFSSNLQQATSNEDQERLCRLFIKKHGWVVEENWVVRDEAKSASTTAGRQGFLRLLGGIRTKPRPFDVIVVDDLSRLTREADVTISIHKECQQRGIRLVGASDGFDSSQPGSKLQAFLRGMINETFLDDLAQKTHRGLEGYRTDLFEFKDLLDRFIHVLRALALEAKAGKQERLIGAPRLAPRRRLDETAAARKPGPGRRLPNQPASAPQRFHPAAGGGPGAGRR